MQLYELYLDRQLYREGQTPTTPDSEYQSANLADPASVYLASGGNAAIDVNNNTVNISGSKVKTGAIESTNYSYTSPNVYSNAGTQFDLNNGALISKQFAIDSNGNATFAGAIVGGSLNIPNTTSVLSWHVDSSGNMWSGANAANFGSAPFRVDNAGNVYAASITLSGYIPTGGAASDVNSGVTTINGGKITANTISTNKLQANSVTADKLTAGVFQVGGTSEPTAILIAAGSISGNSRISFNTTSGARVWGDSSNNIGINATGGQLFIYCNSTQVAVFQTSPSRTIFNSELAIENTAYLSSGTNTSIWGNNNTDVIIDMTGSFFVKDSGSECFRTNSVGTTTQGYFYSPNVNHIDIGTHVLTLTGNATISGTPKPAIVPTSDGYKALYCVESPEVWFMDFTPEKDVLDPLFRETTVPPYRYIKCEDGWFQVWGRRKGFDATRFESKTEAEFVANERFLNMNKP